MGDQAALQEAIQRARQLAAKISQNAPVKRTASEMEDTISTGAVKVTLAYEKPANSEQHSQHRSSREERSNSRSRDSRDRDDRRDRDSRDYQGNNNNNNSSNNNGNHSRDSSYPSGGTSQLSNNNNYSSNTMLPNSSGHHSSMLGGGGSNHYSGGGEERIEIIIPHAVIGLVIGKGGENIKRIQNESGATVRVDPNTVDEKGNKVCTITGTKKAVEEAHIQVSNVIENSATNKRPRTQMDPNGEQYRMKIPASRTGAIIGKGGETIKSIKLQSGCDIELDKHAKECGPEESVFVIRGSQDRIAKARSLIEARLASRGRDGDMSHSRGGSHSSVPKGFATGANAAPVAQFNDLPSAGYPAAASGQQNSADMNAAWAAYLAQYSTLFNQAGVQPAANTAATSVAGMPYVGQNLMAATTASQQQQQVPHHDQQTTQSQQQQPSSTSAPNAGQGGQPDYSDDWIKYYLANGRPDYAEQLIEMKKQQAQKQQQQSQQQPQQ